jgi:muramidase (phage lysozyme)
LKARKALSDNKADYGALGQESIKAERDKKVAAIQANAKVANAVADAATQVEGAKITVDRDKSIAASRRSARKAGMLAGGAALLGVGAMQMNKKDEPDSMLAEYKALMGKNDGRLSAADQKIEEARAKLNSFGDKPVSKDAPSSNVATGTSNSTTTTTGSSKPSTGGAWAKLRRVISLGEGTQGDKGYNIMFGGREFTDMSAHPNSPASTPWGTQSEAAGKYQFMKPTWDGAKKALGLTDFSRESQEKAGRYLTSNRGVNPDQLITSKDEFRSVMDKLAPEWASLPYSGTSPSGYGNGGSYYGQGGKSLDVLWDEYNRN